MSQSQSAPDLYRFNVSRNVERQKSRTFPVDQELYDLCNLSGVTLDSEVFQILLDLIRINVSPNALVQVLKKMTKQATVRGSLESAVPSERSRSVTPSVSSRDSGDSVFDPSRASGFKEDSAAGDGEKSTSERLASRLRALKAGRKGT